MKSRFDPLTGTQKAAVVLMQMEPAQAAQVMEQFTDAEAEEIAAEIVRHAPGGSGGRRSRS